MGGKVSRGAARRPGSRPLDGYPNWSPDGRRVVVRSDRDGPVGLYSLKLR
ncbi:MAG: hypothetical protein DMD34_06365 [Gemmatimonadetes bacterium]|nr:MAG: hypothetical protein DMD46_02025 [Gemmatimonadota bacterium]PYP95749.1 MAG: hypothetical protein DMD34_06365 [Gemmatimonadota bacterium]